MTSGPFADRRQRLLDELRAAAADDDWYRCEQLCFKALVGLPNDVQLSLPRMLLQRYLAGFERRWPDEPWVRAQLEDPSLPEGDYNEARSASSATFDRADRVFLDGILYLTIATESRDHPTWFGLSAVRAATRAHGARAWADADPAAAQRHEERLAAEQDEAPACRPPLPLPDVEPAFAAALRREWAAAIDHLAALDLGAYPDLDPARVEREFAEWLPTHY